MSDGFNEKYDDIKAWVEQAKNDPVSYRSRKVTHILLHAIASSATLKDVMYLKGGVLMMLTHGSPRGTQDVDFSIATSPEPFASQLSVNLDPHLFRSSRILGYFDILVQVQSTERKPKPKTFEEDTGAALKVKLGYARRGSPEEKAYNAKMSSNVLKLDLSFNEPINDGSEFKLSSDNITVKSYSLEDVVAEKLRALLQQGIRKRFRRQDIFDISWIIDHFEIDDEKKVLIMKSLQERAEARDVPISLESFNDPDVYNRAYRDWNSMSLEIGELPDFKQCFEKVRQLYISLPWKP